MHDVLVVDDDFMVAEIHRRFVERVDGFRVAGVAGTGAEALEAVARLDPALVLLDVYLPDMTGLAVLQRLRGAGNPVAVIMITAAREIDTVEAARHRGATDYLIKPFEFPALETKLRAFAARADAMRTVQGVDQPLVDALFGSAADAPSVDGPTPLPKGLGVETSTLVLDALRSRGEMSAAECAEAVGISRVSARRYLEHYLSSGLVALRLQYGSGRPERRYRLQV